MMKLCPNESAGKQWRRRPPRSAAAAALAAVVMLVTAFTGLVGCGSGKETSTTLSVTTSATVGSTTSTVNASTSLAVSTTSSLPTEPDTTILPTTTTEALSSAETRLPNGNIRAMGFIAKVWESGGIRHLSIDYTEMLTGEEATAAAIKDGEISPGEDLPNDYYIRNVNPQLRNFTVSKSVSITASTLSDLGPIEPQPATWKEFKSFWDATPPAGAEHMHMVPWWIERRGAEIVSITEQYLP